MLSGGHLMLFQMDIFHINVKCKLHEGSNLKVSVYIKLLSIFFSDDPALPPAG